MMKWNVSRLHGGVTCSGFRRYPLSSTPVFAGFFSLVFEALNTSVSHFTSTFVFGSRKMLMAAFESRFRRFQFMSTHFMYRRSLASTLRLAFPSPLYTGQVCRLQRLYLVVVMCSHMSTVSTLPGAASWRVKNCFITRYMPLTDTLGFLQCPLLRFRAWFHTIRSWTCCCGQPPRRVRCPLLMKAYAVPFDGINVECDVVYDETSTESKIHIGEQVDRLRPVDAYFVQLGDALPTGRSRYDDSNPRPWRISVQTEETVAFRAYYPARCHAAVECCLFHVHEDGVICPSDGIEYLT